MKLLSPLFLFLSCYLALLSGCGHPVAVAVFDVPSIIGKNIKDVQAALGPPTSTDEHSKAAKFRGVNDGLKRWDRPTSSLVVDYDLLTGHVKHLLLDGNNRPKGFFEGEEDALNAGALRRDDPDYSLSFITLKDPNQVWMLRITPTR